MAIIREGEVLRKYAGLKRLEIKLESLKNEYLRVKSELNAQRRTASGPEKGAIEDKLMRLIVENESLFVVAKNQYVHRVEEALRGIARQHAAAKGYNAVIKSAFSANRSAKAVDAVDITSIVTEELANDPVTTEDFDRLLEEAKMSIRVVEKNLKSEILYEKI